jgi:hypothetical protein
VVHYSSWGQPFCGSSVEGRKKGIRKPRRRMLASKGGEFYSKSILLLLIILHVTLEKIKYNSPTSMRTP